MPLAQCERMPVGEIDSGEHAVSRGQLLGCGLSWVICCIAAVNPVSNETATALTKRNSRSRFQVMVVFSRQCTPSLHVLSPFFD